MSPVRLLFAIIITTALGAASPANAQALLTHMKIVGLDGDATHRDHKGEIVLTGYSQTIGTRNCSRIVVTKLIDRASPGLITRAATNFVTPQVSINIQRYVEGARAFFVVTLDQVTMERIELAEQSEQLIERVVLAPRAIRIEYKPQDDTGATVPPIVSTFAC
ncbi:MAG: type VI secretion system tube protein Hcp [Pseudomonadota bacterium]